MCMRAAVSTIVMKMRAGSVSVLTCRSIPSIEYTKAYCAVEVADDEVSPAAVTGLSESGERVMLVVNSAKLPVDIVGSKAKCVS